VILLGRVLGASPREALFSNSKSKRSVAPFNAHQGSENIDPNIMSVDTPQKDTSVATPQWASGSMEMAKLETEVERLRSELDASHNKNRELEQRCSELSQRSSRSAGPSMDYSRALGGREQNGDLYRAAAVVSILIVGFFFATSSPSAASVASAQAEPAGCELPIMSRNKVPPCRPPPHCSTDRCTRHQWLALAAMGLCSIAALLYPHFGAKDRTSSESKLFLAGMLLIFAAYGNVAHSQSWITFLPFAGYAAAMIAAVLLVMRRQTTGQKVAGGGLLLFGALSCLSTINSFLFCLGSISIAMSASENLGRQHRQQVK